MTRKNIFLYLVLFLCLEAGLFGLLSFGKQQAEERYIATVVEQHRREYAAILESFSRLARFVASSTFLQPEAVAMFAEAAQHKGVERDRLRTRLYDHLHSSYNNITPQGFRQVIYTFGDGICFLRMHTPERYGDQIFAVRPALRLAHTEKRFVQGFELGRWIHAFRYVFPVQHDGEYQGIVEVGVPFYAVSQALHQVYKEEYSLILKKEALDKVLVAGTDLDYQESQVAPGYLQEKADLAGDIGQHTGHLSEEVLAALNAEIRSRIAMDLAGGEAFTRAVRSGGQDYLVTFLPVSDVEGKRIGYIVAYGKEPNLASIRNGYLVALLLATVLLVLLFGLHFRANRKIAGQLDFQRQLMEAIPIPVCLKGLDGVFTNCNQAFAELFRQPKEKIIGQRNAGLIEEGAADQQQSLDKRVIASGDKQQEEMHLSYPDGTSRDLLVVKAPFVDEQGRVAGVIGSAVDITEQKMSEAEIEKSRAELDQIFNTAANGMWVVDTNFTVLRANKTFYALTDLSEQEVIGRECYNVFPGLACHTDQCPLANTIQAPRRREVELTKVLPSGRRIDCLVTSTPYFGRDGKLLGIIEDFKDITRYKELEAHLREIAITDELTGLFNRRGFLTLAEKQLGNALRADHDMFLIFADLDNMKEINDTLGHETGDLALATAASLLRTTFRQADILARLGGDEFAVFISCKPGTDSEQAILSRLEANIAQENKGGDLPFSVAVSFGVVQLQENETLGQVMIRADGLMYESKIRRKGEARKNSLSPPVKGGEA
ncbi:MAG: diguanylate cyclase [Desulfurivibrionaceae bacterium]|nr:diguanylate cyclase [Desulfurivibrionaceae bacterium]